jgi:excinuclease ABC subunit A
MGTRLKKEAQYFKINDKNITQLARMDIGELASWFEDLPNHLN